MKNCKLCEYKGKGVEVPADYENGKEYLCRACLTGAIEYYYNFKPIKR